MQVVNQIFLNTANFKNTSAGSIIVERVLIRGEYKFNFFLVLRNNNQKNYMEIYPLKMETNFCWTNAEHKGFISESEQMTFVKSLYLNSGGNEKYFHLNSETDF